MKKPNHTLKVKVQADKSVIPAGKTGQRILEINLTAPPALDEKPHIPLNLSLVLDRSGSMHGDKLHFVKQAAAHVIDLMSEQDRLALVVYDDKVNILQSSQFLTNKAKTDFKAKIRGVETGASTFLYGGWLAGCRQVAEAVSEGSFNRTLLMTDGLANVGVRDIGALSVHAQELFMRGISTSCFGVGLDYDEHLLESMANHGGGSFHFLETLNAIPLVYEREFDEIISVAVKDLRITLDLPEGVTASVSANWHSQLEGNQLSIFPGSLSADQSQSIYLQLAILNGDQVKALEIPVVVTGVDPAQAQHKVEASIAFTPVAASEESSVPQDRELMERFAVVDLADKANEALKRERIGDRAGSSAVMKSALNLHDKNISKNVREKYEHFSTAVSTGLDAAERKRRHFQEYQSKRGGQFIRDYRLIAGEGLLIAAVEGQNVFINTGADISIGRNEEWVFLNEFYRLPSTNHGVDCDQLSSSLNSNVDVMLGMDILQNLWLRIDPERRVVQFSPRPLHSRGLHLALANAKGKPSLKALMDGKEFEFRLMTGVKFNYAPQGSTLSFSNPKQDTDAIPGGVQFEPQVIPQVIKLDGQPVTLQMGVMPDDLRQKIGLGLQEGVLGAEFFRKVPSTLAFPEEALILLI